MVILDASQEYLVTQYACHSIQTPERCFRNRCWLGKEQSPEQAVISQLKYPCN